MSALKEQIALWRAALWAWLLKHAFTVILVVLACLFFSVVFSGKKSQDVKEVAEHEHQQGVLKDKQVKRTEAVIAQKLDSIRTQTIIIEKVVHVRDSAVVAARHHEAKADSLLKSKYDEDFTAPTTATARVAGFLAGYRPAAYQTGAWADSIK